MKRGTVAFLAAVALALIVGHLLRDTPGYVVRDDHGTYEGDITHYVYWTRLVSLGGMQAAYGGTWPETYAVYPPVTLYPYWVVGTLYRAFEDPTFDPQRAQRSFWLHEAIKSVALVWHVLTGSAIYLVLRRRAGANVAGLAAALYVANPAALYDVAHWAQPDGAHSLFSVLAIAWLGMGALSWAWVAMALAALAKPQAWSILPVFGVASLLRLGLWIPRPLSPTSPRRLGWDNLRQPGVRELGRSVLAAAAVALVVVLPFLVTGHTRDLLSLPATISRAMPVVSADAHNVWRLVLEAHGQDPIDLNDSARLLGPLTYRQVAAVLVIGVLAYSIWLHATRRAGLAESAALAVLGWFDFTTQAHENHLFFALPLLALAWPARRQLLSLFGLLSLTVLLNMLLHDQLVLEALGSSLYDARLDSLRLVNAAANLACWVGWAVWAALRRPAETPVLASAVSRSITVSAGGRSDAVVRTTIPG